MYAGPGEAAVAIIHRERSRCAGAFARPDLHRPERLEPVAVDDGFARPGRVIERALIVAASDEGSDGGAGRTRREQSHFEVRRVGTDDVAVQVKTAPKDASARIIEIVLQ